MIASRKILTKRCMFRPRYIQHVYQYYPCRQWSNTTYVRYFGPDVPPIKYMTESLQNIHDITGLPWWATIALTTLGLRTVITLPAHVYSHYIMAKVELLQPEIKDLSQELKLEVDVASRQRKWSERQAKLKYSATMKRLVSELYVRDNCHPAKATLALWLQIPIWLVMSFSLRNMCGWVPPGVDISKSLSPEMNHQGLLWFCDLTINDHTWILPVMFGTLNFINIEMNYLRVENPTRFMKIITGILRLLNVWLIVLAGYVPSAMSWYWTCSSTVGLLQNILLKYPRVRRACRIPETPSESCEPFKDLLNNAKRKYGRHKAKQKQ